MKKIISFFVIAMMLISMLVLPSSAAIDASTLDAPIDITNDVKSITSYDLYLNKVPVIRADAQLILAYDYDMSLCETAPGYGTRTITFTDWEEKGMTSFFYDEFDLGEGVFDYYPTQWFNVTESGNWDDRAKVTFTCEIYEPGTYEFVFLGAAQIKAENVGNPAKERGFCFSIDGGEIYSVNISNTRGVFREYSYEYSHEDLEAGYDGNNTTYYQPTYYYGFSENLSAGTHTIEFYHLFNSSDGTQLTGNGSRINLIGIYVEKFLDESQFDSYVYPSEEDSTTAEETTTEAQESESIEETTAEAGENTTEAATDPKETESATEAATKAETTTEEATTKDNTPSEQKGCKGSVIGLGVIIALVPAALIIKRKKD